MKNWKFVSKLDRVSLHDNFITGVERGEDLVLHFGRGIDVLADHPLNPTGRHQATGEAAVILSGGVLTEQDAHLLRGGWEVYDLFLHTDGKMATLRGISLAEDRLLKLTIPCRGMLCGWNAFVGKSTLCYRTAADHRQGLHEAAGRRDDRWFAYHLVKLMGSESWRIEEVLAEGRALTAHWLAGEAALLRWELSDSFREGEYPPADKLDRLAALTGSESVESAAVLGAKRLLEVLSPGEYAAAVGWKLRRWGEILWPEKAFSLGGCPISTLLEDVCGWPMEEDIPAGRAILGRDMAANRFRLTERGEDALVYTGSAEYVYDWEFRRVCYIRGRGIQWLERSADDWRMDYTLAEWDIQPGGEEEFFPLAVGNRWRYTGSDGRTGEIRVIAAAGDSFWLSETVRGGRILV